MALFAVLPSRTLSHALTGAVVGVLLILALLEAARSGERAVGLQLVQVGAAGAVAWRLWMLTASVGRHRRFARELQSRQTVIGLLEAVSSGANMTGSPRRALHEGLLQVCTRLGWPLGTAYLADDNGTLRLSTGVYPGGARDVSETLADDRGARCLQGQVAVRAMRLVRPVCSHDGLAADGVGSGEPVHVAVPVLVGDEVVGVLTFLVADTGPYQLAEDVREALATVGIQLGRVVERARAHREAADRAEQLQEANDALVVAERAQRDLRLQAERKQAAQKKLVALTSHELRSPLNAVMGFTQLLEGDHLTAEQQEMVGHIMRSGQHLLQLIDGLLDLAAIETGNLELDTVDLPVHRIVEDAVATLAPLAADREVTVVVAVPADMHAKADELRLMQVMLNLLSNAVKYNRQGGTVTVHAASTADDTVRVTVTDTGVGIASELLPRLFRPFDRLDADPETRGTGLGLVVTRLLVEAMQGHIGVTSDPGAGTQFWFDLPRGPDRCGRHDRALLRSESHVQHDGSA